MVQRETVHAAAGGVDEDRARAVHDVAGRDLVAARLQALHGRGGARFTHGPVHPKIVATTPLTSAFDDPSSGSTQSTYEARVPQAT